MNRIFPEQLSLSLARQPAALLFSRGRRSVIT